MIKRLFYFTLISLAISSLLISCGKEKEVLIEPQLITSVDSLFFNGTETKDLIISTKPASRCEYQITSYPDWIKLSSTPSGVIVNNLVNIRISSDFSGYLPGTYQGQIDFTSTSGNKSVLVKGVVEEQFGYSIPDSIAFSIFGVSKGVTIKNEGNIAINFSIATSNDYISTSSMNGIVSVGQQSDIVFLVNRTNMTTGKYNSQIYLNINNILDTINVSIENFKEQKIMLTTDVIDAEYSKVKDILVFVSATPSKINIYNESLETISSIDLEYSPTCVSVSSDGNTAVVGHDGHITYVDLSNKRIIKSYSVSCNALDIVLGNNKWAYVFPRDGQWVSFKCVNLNLSNDNEVLQTGRQIYAGVKARMHPSGNYIYGATKMSPSDIEKYKIQNGGASYLYDSPYHGDYLMGGDLWFSEDGLRIFTRGKTVLKTSATPDQDMLYNGTITLESTDSRIMWLDHSSIKNNLYLISSIDYYWTGSRRPYIYVYNSNNLVYKSKYELEKYLVGEQLYEAEPYFVFCNSNGSSLMVLTKAEGSGLVNEWAIQKIFVE